MGDHCNHHHRLATGTLHQEAPQKPEAEILNVIEFIPPISSRETEELIAIAMCTTDEWQQEAIDQANAELARRNITQEFRQGVIDNWQKEVERMELAYQQQLIRNEKEGYSPGIIIYIFLFAPIILTGRWPVDLSLSELKRENYQRKFKQRLFLLLGGTAFWILLAVAGFNDDEKERQAEIDKVDISAWERNRIDNDTLILNDTITKDNK